MVADADANRDAGVDPRFDPQFQRGYVPSQHTARPRQRPVSAPREDDSVPHEEPIRAEPVPSAPAEAQEDLEPPRRNPFPLILLLASLAAIGGAALLLWRRIAEDPYGGYGGYGGDVGRVFVQQFSDAAFAPLMTAGILGICLWLALGALSRRRDG
jgi:hypothetical protein